MKIKNYEFVLIRKHPEWIDQAAIWFNDKWKVPTEAYRDSMKECVAGTNSFPQWYIVLDQGRIIGGLGVIENDFHDRKDLFPNVCAVYVADEYRCQGIAGEMLSYVCKDMMEKGIDTLYLLTSHDSFYERYGWELFCMVHPDGEEGEDRLYIHVEQ